MKINSLRTFLLIAGLVTILFACKKMEDQLTAKTVSLVLPQTPYDYSRLDFGGIDLFFGINNDVATLGRVLFYDTHLSINNTVSCGSCHKQSIAFSDNVTFSSGFENHKTLRNTLPIQNLSNIGSFISGPTSLFWDGRATFLPSMVLMPITNHVEMGMSNVNSIVDKVKSLSYYDNLFFKAFRTNQIDATKVSAALSSFVSSIFSGNTRFDRSSKNQTELNGLEHEGRLLFFKKYDCNSCHKTEQLNGYQAGGGFVNIGLEENYIDKGLQNITNTPTDNGKFKIPNLRNITLTAPYMHDGRFSTLSAVIDHYSHGIANSPALDPRLRSANGQPMRMNISEHEKTALLAFLNTLTDFAMITDIKYSNPFKAQ